ncbi:MAG: tetratricopeptide repeat protein, partial [Rubrivivax sp.]|nr:tetratricopeptide repeat protein [Rubrivivax sp.]
AWRKMSDSVNPPPEQTPPSPPSQSPPLLPPQVLQQATSTARPSRVLYLCLGVLVVGLAGAGYLYTGAPQVVGKTSDQVVAELRASAPGASAETGQAHTREQVEAMVVQLAERMQGRPDDAEGWLMLGRAQMMLGRMPEALLAYERLVKLRPDDANTLVDYADALAVNNGRTLEGEPLRLIERALKLEPDNLKALMLAGTAAFDREDHAVAVRYWDRVVSIGPADQEFVQMARDGANAARERGKLPPAAATAPVVPVAPVAQVAAPGAPVAAALAASAVSGTVRLSPKLQALAAPEDMVFIFARPAEGSRMPLAIVRKQVKDLPVAFTLDDSTSMSPAARLSGAQHVIVGARISKSGQAMPQPGDLQSLSEPVKVGTTGLVLEISAQLP